MERPDNLRPAPRILFESLEDRLALAADAAADFWLDEQVLDVAIEQHAEQHDRRIVPHQDLGSIGDVPASAAPAMSFTGRGQTVAIIDSGIAYDHVALGGGYGSGYRVVGGWDFAENDADPYDDGPAGFHGTHVAGVIGAAGSGRAGLASGVDLVALRVFDDAGNGYFSWVEESLKWVHERRHAFANPITTVNLSLGSEWNDATVPNWAVLEDELRQLYEDGIFVAVSAGNSFQQYGGTGLSYPAVSQYVFPVASVDAAGNLSRFSQRDSRVLAAPGERIVSTVPDHYFGGDGIKNDWDTASGTSMAAPYVAAASVLVRQAMRAAGQTIVTPSGIYEVLRDTADLVYDSATKASYHRVNLDRALDSIDGGGGTNDPVAIVGNRAEITGTDSADIFVWNGVTKMATINGVSRSLVSVQYVTFHGGDGRDSIHMVGGPAAETATLRAGSVTLVGGGLTVNADAVESIRVVGDGRDQAFLYDTAGSDYFDAGPKSGLMRGSGYDNRVQDFGAVTAYATAGMDVAKLYDSAGNDYFDVGPKSGVLRGSGFYLYAGGFDEVRAYATAGGRDRANLYDSHGGDWFDAGPNSALLRGSAYYNRAESFEEVNALAIWGGFDQANLYGSTASDQFTQHGTTQTLAGAGYQLRAEQFDRVRILGQGGVDQAALYDLQDGDLFYGRRNLARLTAAAVATELYDFDAALLYDRVGQRAKADIKALEYVFQRMGG